MKIGRALHAPFASPLYPGNTASKTGGTLNSSGKGKRIMGSLIKSLVLGFIAGAIAYVTVHEAINYWLMTQGYSTYVPWPTDPRFCRARRRLLSIRFGVASGARFSRSSWAWCPGSMTVRGALLGLIGTAVIGTLVAIPLIRGEQPFA